MKDEHKNLIKSMLEKVENLKGLKINDFLEVEKIRYQSLTNAGNVLEILDSNAAEIPFGILDKALNDANSTLSRMKRECLELVEIVQGNREAPAKKIEAAAKDLDQNLHPVAMELRLASLQVGLGDKEGVLPVALENAGAIRESRKEVEKILKTLKDKIAEKAIEAQKEKFASRAASHERREWAWFAGMLFSLIFVVWAFLDLAMSEWNAKTVPDAIGTVFRRLITITLPLTALRLSLTKYNAERNLRIIYDHRTSVMNEFNDFMAGIDDEDKEAKNAFRLEIAKYVFSDPHTGYLGNDVAGEINVNPIINMTEKITRGS